MSEPIRLGPVDPTRADWTDMQQEMRAARGELHVLLERVESLVGHIVARPCAVAFASTGAAIEAALDALGGARGGEIVLPALGPVVLGHAVNRASSACRYADVDPKSMTLLGDHAESRMTDATRVIVGVSNHGQPAGLNELASLAARNELPLLEINLGGLGGRIGRDPVGRFGRVSVIGLGDREGPIGSQGAVVVTNDDTLAQALRVRRNNGCAEPKSDWEKLGGIARVECAGWDSRMSAVQAALAIVRLTRFEKICTELEEVFHSYVRRLAMHPDLVLPAPCADGTVRWSHFAIRLGERYSRDDRDGIIQGLLRHDIAATSVVSVLPHEVALRHEPKRAETASEFPVAQRAADRLIALPFSTELSEHDVDLVCQTLQVMIERQSILR